MTFRYGSLVSILIAGLLTCSIVLADAQGGKGAANQDNRPASTLSAQKAAPMSELAARMLRFCRERLGRKVGDGQCAALVEAAFYAIGAQPRLKDAPMSGDYVWGAFVCKLETKDGRQSLEVGEAGKKPDGAKGADVRPGDIIQFRDAKFAGTFKTRDSRYPGGYVRGVYRSEFPHHTAVVEQVSEDGLYCTILQQNADNKMYVVESVLYLPDLAGGWLRVYRPLAKSAATGSK